MRNLHRSDPCQLKMEKKRLIVIDSNSIIHRAYHALPHLTTKKGELVNAVYGFLLVFFKAIREFQPDYIAACFDFPGPTFRHKKFKEYKVKRPPTPKELYQQIPKIKEILEAFNIPIFEKEDFEADDIIGTLAAFSTKKVMTPPIEIIILSGDTDILQLVNPQTKVYVLKRGVKDIVLFDENLVKEKFQGLTPEQILDFKALRGDPSDNIPGVTGVGEKTATQLIKQFRSLENLYSALNQRPLPEAVLSGVNQRLRALLEEYKEQAFLSKMLAQIKIDVPIDFNLEKCSFRKYDREKVINVLRNLEFYSLIEKLPVPQKLTKKVKENLKLW